MRFANLISLFFVLSCSSSNSIIGSYQSYRPANGGYDTSLLIIQNNNRFSLQGYQNQGDYDVYSEVCGAWSVEQDSLLLKPFDTIPYIVKYLPDTSQLLKVELFNSYDCTYLPLAWIFNDINTAYQEIKNGHYSGNISENIKYVSIGLSTGFQSYRKIAIKRDSMHIELHGVFNQKSKQGSPVILLLKGKKIINYCNACHSIYKKNVFVKRKNNPTFPPE